MKFIDVQEFRVSGRAARTTNAREMTPDGQISKLWGQMTPPADSAIIALYTDYESDEHGEYTFVLGAKAGPAGSVPDGMAIKTVPAGRYAVFTSQRGPLQKVVFGAWQRIWSELPSSSNLRSYIADFEVYDQRAVDPADAVVDIYVGVK
jgi:predicted transcriptional regulator YdeE